MNKINNEVKLVGNLGRDMELLTFDNGNKMARCTMATNDYYVNNRGEKIQETQWHNIVAWGKTAEFMASQLSKGHEVSVTGKLVHRTYEDKDGRKRYVSEVVVGQFINHSRKENTSPIEG